VWEIKENLKDNEKHQWPDVKTVIKNDESYRANERGDKKNSIILPTTDPISTEITSCFF
jgi:hypothetical protein